MASSISDDQGAWPSFAAELGAVHCAATLVDLRRRLGPLLTHIGARLLVTAAPGAEAGAPPVLRADIDPGPAVERPSELARAILIASSGHAAPVQLAEVGSQGRMLRATLVEAAVPDALLIPRFDGQRRSVGLLAGAELRLDQGLDLIFARMVVETALERDEGLRRAQAQARRVLTSRQRDCLDAALRGFNSIQIGAELHLQPKTVDAYIAAAARRLGAGNRVAAVALALQLGLIGAA